MYRGLAFSEDKAMYKASRSAKVLFMKSSVEWWKTCKIFALWQACLLSGILLLSGTGFAQLSMASLSGAVKDASGAVVPGANVVATDTSTGHEYKESTDAQGDFTITNMTNGNYKVTVEHAGFSKTTIELVQVFVSQTSRVQVKLGRSSVNTVEVLSGLKVGDTVILSDMSTCCDAFDRVRLK